MPTEKKSSEAIPDTSADTSADASESSGERSPRHAARRRSLLQRLHMPVGKVVAIAAVPSAVFLGTGFTSPLAKADPQPDSPFRGDSCVEMPDEAGQEEAAEETGDGAGEADASPDADEGQDERDPATGEGEIAPAEPDETATPDETAEPTEEPSAETDATEEDDTAASEGLVGSEEPESDGETAEPDPSATDGGADDGADEGTAEGTGGEATEEPTDEATEETADGGLLGETGDAGTGEEPTITDGDGGGLLGGLGDALDDLLNPGDDEDEQDGGASGGDGEGSTGGDSGDADSSGGGGEETADPEQSEDSAAAGERDDAQDEDAAADEEAEDEAGSDPSAEDDSVAPNEEGQVPFPCPEEKQVAGVDEETALTLPNDPWYLEATSLTLYGLDYHGVVNVTTANGTVKQVLKFTADEIDIGDLHQIVDGVDGVRRHVGTEPGSVSTFRNGQVTMYTERLEGNLFGLIPVVFDPEHQPPLDLPIANFTNVLVTQAGQFGGELTMQGMESYITNDGPTPTE